jgi:hypothetical protein
VRDTLGTGIYFMVYESGKQLGTTFAGDQPNSNRFAVVASGGLCGLVSWAMICESKPRPDHMFLPDLGAILLTLTPPRPNRLGQKHLSTQLPFALQG